MPPKQIAKKKLARKTSNQTSSSVDDGSSEDAFDSTSEGEETTRATYKPNVMRNQVDVNEVSQAAQDRLFHLARYRKLFEPFVTPKVMNLFNEALSQRRGQSVSTVNNDVSGEIVTQPPALINCKMRDYQLEGLSWLVSNYYRSINCILGDEMGLGKTLQSISFVAHMVFAKKVSGPFLFIVPLSVLFNWMNEFKRWCPSLNVLRMHSGDKDEQARLRTVLMDSARNEVVLATYDTVKQGGLASAFKKVIWRAVFLDEGHRVRNEDSEAAKSCGALRSQFRVILTGTPLHNNLHEMGALLNFIAPNIFTNLSLFDAGFNLAASDKSGSSKSNNKSGRGGRKSTGKATSRKSGDGDDEDGEEEVETDGAKKKDMKQIDRELLEKAHYMMRPFVLRRVKAEVEQKLPPKLETKINCPMTEMQRELVQKLLYSERNLLADIDKKINNTDNEPAETLKTVTTGASAVVDSSSAVVVAAESKVNVGEEGATKGTAMVVDGDTVVNAADADAIGSGVADGDGGDNDDAATEAEKAAAKVAMAKRRQKRELRGLADCDGINKGDQSRLQGLLAQLRKAANHPFLFPGVEKITLDGTATEDIVTASGKMKVLDKLLPALKAKGHRVVLFSQFTRTLDIISDYLDMRGYKHTRLDGSTNRVMREVRINLFNRENSNLFIFCLSTRAGGEGVNLFTADTVILFDSDWNPQADIQAMARVHRIGQKKIVHIYRLVTAGTVEERIVQRAQKKLFLDVMVNRGSTAQARRLDEPESTTGGGDGKRKRKSAAMVIDVDIDEDEEKGEDDEGESHSSKKRRANTGSVKGDSSAETQTAEAESQQSDRVRAVAAEFADDEDDDAPAAGKLFSALKFGWNSVFSPSALAGQPQEISDADIAVIIDRRRGGLKLPGEDSSSSGDGSGSDVGDKSSTVDLTANSTAASGAAVFETLGGESGLLEDQQMSLAMFDEHAPLADIRELSLTALQSSLGDGDGAAGESTGVTAVVKSGATGSNSAAGGGGGGMTTEITLAAAPGETTGGSASSAATASAVVVGNPPDTEEEYSAAKYRPRRSTSSRTMDVMVEGLGLVTVMKGSIYEKPVSSAAAQDRERKKKDALTAQQLLFVHNGGRQVAGRDFEHQEECQVCSDGGELIVCDNCPCSFHIECLGLDCIPSANNWSCPHHECADCARRASAAGLLFRCEMCELAYCEDCLPAEAVVLGDSKRMMDLGYKIPPNACYVHCSLKCIRAHKKEQDAKEKQRKAKSASSGDSVNSSAESKASEGAGDVASSTRAKKANNSYLTVRDARDVGKLKQSGDDNGEATQQSGQHQQRGGASSPTPTSGRDRAADLNVSPEGRVLSIDAAIGNCSLSDIRARLERDKISAAARFVNLAEIPSFRIRLHFATGRIKALLLKAVHCVHTHEEVVSATHGRGSDSSTRSSVVPTTDDSLHSKILDFSGVPVSLSLEGKCKVFLSVVSIIAQANKIEIQQLSQVLGLSIVTPMKRANPALAPEPAFTSDGLPIPPLPLNKFHYEPKFTQIKDGHNRKRIEEAIAVFLVIPSPQNLLLHRSASIEATTGSECATHCVLYCLRLLQALGEYVTDANKQYFTAMALLDEGMPSLNAWLPVYPSGRAADAVTKRAWVEPACRLYKSLLGPVKDKNLTEGLRSTLIVLLNSRIKTQDTKAMLSQHASPFRSTGTLSQTSASANGGYGNESDNNSNGGDDDYEYYSDGDSDGGGGGASGNADYKNKKRVQAARNGAGSSNSSSSSNGKDITSALEAKILGHMAAGGAAAGGGGVASGSGVVKRVPRIRRDRGPSAHGTGSGGGSGHHSLPLSRATIIVGAGRSAADFNASTAAAAVASGMRPMHSQYQQQQQQQQGMYLQPQNQHLATLHPNSTMNNNSYSNSNSYSTAGVGLNAYYQNNLTAGYPHPQLQAQPQQYQQQQQFQQYTQQQQQQSQQRPITENERHMQTILQTVMNGAAAAEANQKAAAQRSPPAQQRQSQPTMHQPLTQAQYSQQYALQQAPPLQSQPQQRPQATVALSAPPQTVLPLQQQQQRAPPEPLALIPPMLPWLQALPLEHRREVIELVDQLVCSAVELLRITTTAELNRRVQQFERSLVTTAASAVEYSDKITLPSRLAKIVQEYRKSMAGAVPSVTAAPPSSAVAAGVGGVKEVISID